MGRRLGVMGGTFDPIHYGHLVTAEEALVQFALDTVIFVPTGQPWMKHEREVSPAEDRYLMTVIATASNPRFQVSRIDIDREGPTYTVDTLRGLSTEHPDGELYFITGADATDLAGLDKLAEEFDISVALESKADPKPVLAALDGRSILYAGTFNPTGENPQAGPRLFLSTIGGAATVTRQLMGGMAVLEGHLSLSERYGVFGAVDEVGTPALFRIRFR